MTTDQGPMQGAGGFALPANARCPECNRSDVVGVIYMGRKLGGCPACRAFWEPLPSDAPADVMGTPQPFRKSCDNCAFHQNSPERRDPERWRELTEAFAYQEKPFYCHKGVALKVDGDDHPLDMGFRYPVNALGQPDVPRLRLCAGFIAWWRALDPHSPVPGLPTPTPETPS